MEPENLQERNSNNELTDKTQERKSKTHRKQVEAEGTIRQKKYKLETSRAKDSKTRNKKTEQ